jgi:hypothetical protein
MRVDDIVKQGDLETSYQQNGPWCPVRRSESETVPAQLCAEGWLCVPYGALFQFRSGSLVGPYFGLIT